TGAGKSVLLGLLAAQFRRYANAQVFAFDVGYSMWMLAEAASATHYDLAAGRPDAIRLQPLVAVDDPAERAWAADWLETLIALDDRVAVPVLLYLFRCVERRLGSQPTLILVDEAWLPLMHSLFGPRLHQWLLTLRKQNAAVVLATQSPAQLARLPFRHTIVNSCPTKIYLPNPDAITPGQIDLYRELGLNAREIESIAR